MIVENVEKIRWYISNRIEVTDINGEIHRLPAVLKIKFETDVCPTITKSMRYIEVSFMPPKKVEIEGDYLYVM